MIVGSVCCRALLDFENLENGRDRASPMRSLGLSRPEDTRPLPGILLSVLSRWIVSGCCHAIGDQR